MPPPLLFNAPLICICSPTLLLIAPLFVFITIAKYKNKKTRVYIQHTPNTLRDIWIILLILLHTNFFLHGLIYFERNKFFFCVIIYCAYFDIAEFLWKEEDHKCVVAYFSEHRNILRDYSNCTCHCTLIYLPNLEHLFLTKNRKFFNQNK